MEEEKVQIDKSSLEEVMYWVGNIEDHIAVVLGICDLDVNSSAQGYAFMDAIKGALNMPQSIIKNIQEEIKKAYPEGGAAS